MVRNHERGSIFRPALVSLLVVRDFCPVFFFFKEKVIHYFNRRVMVIVQSLCHHPDREFTFLSSDAISSGYLNPDVINLIRMSIHNCLFIFRF